MRIEEAGPGPMTAVLSLSHEVWGEGMDLADYTRFHLTLKDSAWGRRNYRFLIGRDETGDCLSSLKLYTLPGRFEGRPVRLAGIGGLFTPSERRGQGHAAALLEAALEIARGEGAALALLVSEIGAAFYQQHRFRALPATEAACRARMPAPWPKEPAWVESGDPFRAVPGLRRGVPADLDALAAIHHASTSRQRLVIERDRAAWEQALLKSSLGRRLRGDGEEELLVVEGEGAGGDRGRVAAYALLQTRPGTLRWLEHGARPGFEDRLVDLFWCALGRARRAGSERLEGWSLPRSEGGGSFYPIARRNRDLPVVMARSLDPNVDLPEFTSEEECRIFELDAF